MTLSPKMGCWSASIQVNSTKENSNEDSFIDGMFFSIGPLPVLFYPILLILIFVIAKHVIAKKKSKDRGSGIIDPSVKEESKIIIETNPARKRENITDDILSQNKESKMIHQEIHHHHYQSQFDNSKTTFENYNESVVLKKERTETHLQDEMDERISCPKCNSLISVHSPLCSNCGFRHS